MLVIVLIVIIAGVICSLTFIEKTELVIVGCTLAIFIPILIWMILASQGVIYNPVQKNQTINQSDDGFIPFVFIDDYYKNIYDTTSKIALFLTLFKQEIREVPVDHVGILTVEGKIVGHFRRGGPYIHNPIFTVESRSNKNIEILFNKTGGANPDFAIGTSTADQSKSYKKDFIEMYSVAIARKREVLAGITRGAYEDAQPTNTEIDIAKKVWEQEEKDAVMHTQTTLFPEVNLVIDIDIQDDTKWQHNIELFWKNVEGQTEEKRREYIISQMVANTKAVLNEIFKKFPYGKLAALLRVGAMSYELLKKVSKLNESQELGLNIRTSSVSALHAPKDMHEAQINISIAKAKKEKEAIDADKDLYTSKRVSEGEAYNIKVKGKEEAGKNTLLNKAAAMLTKMDLLAKAKGAKEMNVVEVRALSNLLKTAKANGVDAQIIIDAEYALEVAKQYAGAKGTVIIKDNNVAAPGNSGPADNSVSTVLIVQALKEVAEAMKNRP